ncbi:hypothetical protein Q9L58_002334 [Maublancomyces gigas]|uniref:Uncharacterized protein n=1 Tax=Discina gigas TaxID=1032678 RepID=A0ABR3GRQ0_9PEZI
MENPVFKELLTVLPDWSARLRVFSTRYPEVPEPPLSRKRRPSVSEDEKLAAAAAEPVATVVGPHPIRPAADDVVVKGGEELPPAPKQMSKMSAKPTAPKLKFSAINGPAIYYDGEAQTALYQCWTTLNAKRGLLRKEMMGIRRRKIMSLPTANYGYSDEESEEEVEVETKETPEERKTRMAEEKRQAEVERKKAEREKKSAEILEFIDSCLDKAAKGCENAAFLWLKGEGCSGHVNFIAGRMGDAVDRINAEILKASQPEGEVEEQEDDDEGLGADADMEDAEPSLPRKIDEMQRIIRPVRRAGVFP